MIPRRILWATLTQLGVSDWDRRKFRKIVLPRWKTSPLKPFPGHQIKFNSWDLSAKKPHEMLSLSCHECECCYENEIFFLCHGRRKFPRTCFQYNWLKFDENFESSSISRSVRKKRPRKISSLQLTIDLNFTFMVASFWSKPKERSLRKFKDRRIFRVLKQVRDSRFLQKQTDQKLAAPQLNFCNAIQDSPNLKRD